MTPLEIVLAIVATVVGTMLIEIDNRAIARNVQKRAGR